MLKWLAKGVLVLLAFFSYSEAGLLKTLNRGLQTCQVYKKVHGKEFIEVTEDLLGSSLVSSEVKQAILEKKRRVFLFQYPSDGMQIKGYVSFVSNAPEQHLLVFIRGGSGIYDVKSPGKPCNFWGDHTILYSTYRGGPSPGRDEFGGRDVVDVKHLIDYIPKLEEQLGICFTNREKVAVGFSRGGMQLFLALKRFPDLKSYFNRAVTICGVLDLERFLEQNRSISRLIRFVLLQRVDQKWKDLRNPLKICSFYPKEVPLLVIQSADDRLVDPSTGKEIVERLKANDVPVLYREKQGVPHCHHSLGTFLDEWLDCD